MFLKIYIKILKRSSFKTNKPLLQIQTDWNEVNKNEIKRIPKYLGHMEFLNGLIASDFKKVYFSSKQRLPTPKVFFC